MQNQKREYLIKMADWYRRFKTEWEACKSAVESGDQEAIQKAEKQIDALMEESERFGSEPETGH